VAFLQLYGQTVGWIKMPLGKEVGLGPGHIVLDGDPAGTQSPTAALTSFGPCLLWPNGRPSQQLLSSCTHCAAEATEFGEITQNKGHYAVQFHSKSSILVPIESSCLWYDFLFVINTNSYLAPFPRYSLR